MSQYSHLLLCSLLVPILSAVVSRLACVWLQDRQVSQHAFHIIFILHFSLWGVMSSLGYQVKLSPHQPMVHLIPFHASNWQIPYEVPCLSCFGLPTLAAPFSSGFVTCLHPSSSFSCCVWPNQYHVCCHWCRLCSVPWERVSAAALPASGFPCMHKEGQGGPWTEPFCQT